jgi:lysophospholipase L1-like esterase
MHKNIQFAYLWLKDKVKQQYHFSVHAHETNQHWSTEAWFNVPVLGTNIIADQKEVNALDDGHPNKQGHANIADRLYDLIKERQQ